MNKIFKRFSLLLVLLIVLGCFFYFHLNQYFNFDFLKHHRAALISYTKQNYLVSVLIFIAIYITVTALSIPGATFLTIVGGFLFGIPLGSCYVIISATIGAFIIFLAVRFAFASYVQHRVDPWIKKMRAGFQRNATQYLLTLRIIPIFPFWIINIVSGLLGVNAYIFLFTTFFGIMPATLVYTSLGSGLGKILDQNETPDLKIIFQPQILIPLFALGFLACLPSLYRLSKRKKHA